jgi:HSP20 family protein
MANLVRWDPFSEFTTLRSAMDRLFEDAWVRPGSTWNGWGNGTSHGGFAFDMYETGDDYVVTATLPGVKPDDLEITVQGNVLTISGEMKPEDGDGERNYHLRERTYGRFSRQVTLPMGVRSDNIQAHMEHGVLKLHLPKAEEAKPRRIQIQAGAGTPQIAQPTVEHESTEQQAA